MNTNIQIAISIIEKSLTGTELELDGLGLTTEDLIYILNIKEYKSFFENLTTLDLHSNQIKKLSKNIFSGLKKLKELDLFNNEIKELHKDIFNGLENLKYLDLFDNQIKEAQEDIFSELENLRRVNLRHNHIKETQQFNGLKYRNGLFVKQ